MQGHIVQVFSPEFKGYLSSGRIVKPQNVPGIRLIDARRHPQRLDGAAHFQHAYGVSP
jgi:hypothetical protein